MTTPQDPNQQQGQDQQLGSSAAGNQPPHGQSVPGQPQPGQAFPGQPQPGQAFPGQPQQGQPWGPPQQAGQPFQGQQPQGPGQPGQPWGGATPAGAAEPPAKPSWKKRLPLVIGAVVAALVFAALRNGLFASDPEAGDCTNGSLTSLQVVDCDDSEATYRIAGVLDDVTGDELSADDSLCLDQWPDSVAYAVDADTTSEQGTGYCLVSVP